MFRPRIIPVLLLRKTYLVKTVKFGKDVYIGDPLNAVMLFNKLKADELIFLDINATLENRTINPDLVKQIGEEANMPFAVGGGIKTMSDIEQLVKSGAERVVINSQALENPEFIKEASQSFGSSTIAVCIDVKKSIFGKYVLHSHSGKKKHKYDIVEFVKKMEEYGAGDIIVQSIDRDGTMKGYDTELIKLISNNVKIPVTALGGASSLENMVRAFHKAGAYALAAGSLFVFKGKNRGVLINYPAKNVIINTFKKNN